MKKPGAMSTRYKVSVSRLARDLSTLSVQSPENKDKRGESNLYARLDEKVSGENEAFLSKQSDFTSVMTIYHCPLFLIYPTHVPVC
jgi:hypothetical protein